MTPATTTVRVTPEARDAINAIAAVASGAAEKRITVSEAILAALYVVKLHSEELAEALNPELRRE